MTDYYEILGVPRDADAATIKKAYKKLAKKHHPDREGGDDSKMSEINAAYETLSDEERRAKYDATGSDQRPDINAAALGHLLQVVTSIIQARGSDVQLFEFVKHQIRNDINQTESSIQRGEDTFEMLERTISRIKYTGKKENIVSSVLKQKLAELKTQIDTIRRNLEVLEKALLIAEDYQYDYSAAPVLHAGWSTVTIKF